MSRKPSLRDIENILAVAGLSVWTERVQSDVNKGYFWRAGFFDACGLPYTHTTGSARDGTVRLLYEKWVECRDG